MSNQTKNMPIFLFPIFIVFILVLSIVRLAQHTKYLPDNLFGSPTYIEQIFSARLQPNDLPSHYRRHNLVRNIESDDIPGRLFVFYRFSDNPSMHIAQKIQILDTATHGKQMFDAKIESITYISEPIPTTIAQIQPQLHADQVSISCTSPFVMTQSNQQVYRGRYCSVIALYNAVLVEVSANIFEGAMLSMEEYVEVVLNSDQKISQKLSNTSQYLNQN